MWGPHSIFYVSFTCQDQIFDNHSDFCLAVWAKHRIRWGGGGGGGGGADTPNRLFMKGIRLSVSPFQRTLNMPCIETSNDCTMDAGSDHWLTKPTEEETL